MSTVDLFSKTSLLALGIAAVCLLTTPADAGPAKGKQVARVKKKKKKVATDTASETSSAEVVPAPFANQESSAHARDVRPFSLFFTTGLVNVLNTGGGGEFNYAVAPHEVLGLSYMHAQFSWLGFSSIYDFYTVNSRTFFGSSFYLLLGGGIRHASSTTRYYSDPTGGNTAGTAPATAIVGDSASNSFSATHVIGEIGLGKRWQFGSGFTLGCDWLAYEPPVSELSSGSEHGAVA